MNLYELTESYEEYTTTEKFYLEEGLKAFKNSIKLYKYVDKIDKRLAKAETKRKVSPAEVSKLKALSKDLMKLADEFKVVEDDFASGKTDRKLSKEKIKRIKRTNERLISLMKKDEMKSIFKKIGLGTLITGILAALWATGALSGLGVVKTAASTGSRLGAYPTT
jgi:hypothetical protein